jgi:hypothetical protein
MQSLNLCSARHDFNLANKLAVFYTIKSVILFRVVQNEKALHVSALLTVSDECKNGVT